MNALGSVRSSRGAATGRLILLEASVLPPVARSRVKRLVDVVLASAALILLLPIFLLVGIAISVSCGWPVLFSQTRVGLVGRPFRMWKFRSMVRNADAMRGELEALNEAPFPAFKLRNDPRVTRLGRVLRRSSIDELPQIWNVLRGDMSLVGPRPPLPGEVATYDAVARRRLRARPGITGLWQIQARHRDESSWDRWLALDLEYINNWDLWLDVRLILRTLAEVLHMAGT